MLNLKPLPLGIRTYKDDYPAVSVQDVINLFPETIPGPAKNSVVLKQAPGYVLFNTMASAGIRGQFKANGIHFVVAGTTLYRGTTGTYTATGTIPGTGLVDMAANDREAGPQVMIVNGSTTGYVFDTTSLILSSVTLTGAATTVAYQDGYFVFDWYDTGKWFISSILNGLQYDSTEYGATNTRPDKVIRVISRKGHIIVFGDETIEYFYNSANGDFPFTKIGEVTIDDAAMGLGARWSLSYVDSLVIFVASDREVYTMAGYELTMISDPTISSRLRQADLDGVSAFSFKMKGHTFYQLNIDDTYSYRYDVKTQIWTRVSHLSGGLHKRHRANTYCYYKNQHLVGDATGTGLYELIESALDDAGTPIRREMITPFYHGNQNPVRQSAIVADFQFGVGNATAPDPVVQLEFTENGQNWSDPMVGELGPVGEFDNKIWWQGLGQYYQRAYKIWWTDPVDTVLMGLYGAN